MQPDSCEARDVASEETCFESRPRRLGDETSPFGGRLKGDCPAEVLQGLERFELIAWLHAVACSLWSLNDC